MAEPPAGPQRHRLVQTEGSLRLQVGSPALMAAQLDALAEAVRLPHLDLRVLPMSRPVDEPLAAGGFDLYDDVVVLGLELGATTIEEPADVAHFRGIFEQYHRPALGGDDARALLERLAAEYRALR